MADNRASDNCLLTSVHCIFFIKKQAAPLVNSKKKCTLAALKQDMVKLAQLVRASDCGSEGRGFETHISPQKTLKAV